MALDRSVAARAGYPDSDTRQDQTRRYEALCAHYRMEPTPNNRGLAVWRTSAIGLPVYQTGAQLTEAASIFFDKLAVTRGMRRKRVASTGKRGNAVGIRDTGAT
jgi:hypothetical protein